MNSIYFNIIDNAVFLEGARRPKNLGGGGDILLFGAYPRMEE
jgi:hypothetical protein